MSKRITMTERVLAQVKKIKELRESIESTLPLIFEEVLASKLETWAVEGSLQSIKIHEKKFGLAKLDVVKRGQVGVLIRNYLNQQFSSSENRDLGYPPVLRVAVETEYPCCSCEDQEDWEERCSQSYFINVYFVEQERVTISSGNSVYFTS